MALNYKEWKTARDVPRKLWGYVRYSMIFYESELKLIHDSRESYIRILERGDQGDKARLHLEEFIRGSFKVEQRLNDMLESRMWFVDPSLCTKNGEGIWFDYVSYYKDQALENFDHVDNLKRILVSITTDEDRVNVEKEIEKYTRFAFANLRNAGVTSPAKPRRVHSKQEIEAFKEFITKMEKLG